VPRWPRRGALSWRVPVAVRVVSADLDALAQAGRLWVFSEMRPIFICEIYPPIGHSTTKRPNYYAMSSDYAEKDTFFIFYFVANNIDFFVLPNRQLMGGL
jgi:hypothetical protein